MPRPRHHQDRAPTGFTVWAASLLIAAVSLGGCSRQTKSGEDTGTGFFTGYEIGDEQDRAEVRKDRPDYRRYE